MAELTVNEQIILARSRQWTPEVDKLLRNWKRRIMLRRNGHNNIARKWSKRHYTIGVPATIITAITSTGVLSTFRNCDENTDDGTCDLNQYLRLSIGIIGLVDVALTAVMTFMNYQEAAADHKDAADNYDSLYGTIESLLTMPISIRGDPVSTLQTIRKEYDDNVRKSPNLPGEYQELSYRVLEQNTQSANQNSFIIPKPTAKDINTRNAEGSMRTTILKSVVDDIMNPDKDNESTRTSSTSSEEYETIIAQENNFDSDDDDKQVCLSFDLDRVSSISSTVGDSLELYNYERNMTRSRLRSLSTNYNNRSKSIDEGYLSRIKQGIKRVSKKEEV